MVWITRSCSSVVISGNRGRLTISFDGLGETYDKIRHPLKFDDAVEKIKNYSEIRDKNIVAIDPGKMDLLFCVDNFNTEATQYRYSQDRRRKETKSKNFLFSGAFHVLCPRFN